MSYYQIPEIFGCNGYDPIDPFFGNGGFEDVTLPRSSAGQNPGDLGKNAKTWIRMGDHPEYTKNLFNYMEGKDSLVSLQSMAKTPVGLAMIILASKGGDFTPDAKIEGELSLFALEKIERIKFFKKAMEILRELDQRSPLAKVLLRKAEDIADTPLKRKES